MSKGKHRSYPEKQKDAEVEKLKQANRRLKSDNEKLKKELATLEDALQKNIQFLKGKTKDLSLPELLEGARKEQKLAEIEKVKEERKISTEEKWKCRQCNSGQLRFIKIPRQDGIFYIRRCDNKKCQHSTRLKRMTEEVEVY